MVSLQNFICAESSYATIAVNNVWYLLSISANLCVYSLKLHENRPSQQSLKRQGDSALKSDEINYELKL